MVVAYFELTGPIIVCAPTSMILFTRLVTFIISFVRMHQWTASNDYPRASLTPTSTFTFLTHIIDCSYIHFRTDCRHSGATHGQNWHRSCISCRWWIHVLGRTMVYDSIVEDWQTSETTRICCYGRCSCGRRNTHQVCVCLIVKFGGNAGGCF